MEETNGHSPELPFLLIGWDGEKQIVDIKAHPSFKSLEFMIALLDMARAKLDTQRRLLAAQQMQQAQQEAMQTQAIKQQLWKGK